MTLADFIKKRPYLIWWTKNYDKLRAESIVEATLNYGNWEDFQVLMKMLGKKKTASVFRNQLKKFKKSGRTNYYPEVKNYFTLYFDKYAP